MATVYVRSTDGNDADDGSTWALADATLAASVTAAGAGGRSYVSDNHAESQASAMTITLPGTVGSPTEVLCVDDAAEPPTALATTGTVTTTGASAIIINGCGFLYGLTFNGGSGASSGPISCSAATAHAWQVYERCVFNGVGTGASSHVNVTADAVGVTQRVDWLLCDLSFANTSHRLRVGAGVFTWRGGSLLAGAAVPAALISYTLTNTRGGTARLIGVDLSQAGSGKALVDVATMVGHARVDFIDCKLGSSVAITTGSFGGPGPYVRVVNCDSGDTNYRYVLHCYQGTITQETTIVRTGGASDGTTPVSRKMVSTADAKFYSPLESDPIVFWNETTGSGVTVTVEVVTDGVTLTDREAWVEVEYLGTSGFPQSLTAKDRAADILAAGANQTSSSETWTTTGLASPVKQALSVTFTPAEKGPVRVRVMLAKASTTMYFCPHVLASSGRQYMVAADGSLVNEGAASVGGGGLLRPVVMSGGLV